MAMPGFIHVMGGPKSGDALIGELFDKMPEMPSADRIHTGGELIQKYNLRPMQQSTAQGQTLTQPGGSSRVRRFRATHLGFCNDRV